MSNKLRRRSKELQQDRLMRKTESFARRAVQEEKEKYAEEMLQTAVIIVLNVAVDVLMNHFWTSLPRKKFQRFGDLFLKRFKELEEGKVNYKDMEKQLWDLAGIKFSLEFEDAYNKALK